MIRAALLSLALSGSALGQFTFTEEFNGALSNTWGQTPPIPQFDIAGASTYLGLPQSSFQTVGAAQVFRMTNVLGPRQIVGMTAAPTLIGARGQVTARINTLTQDATRIDGLFFLMLVDAHDNTRWMSTYLFGSNYSTSRLWGASSSSDPGANYTVDYTSDTWYLLRIAIDGQVIRTRLFADDGVTLIGQYDSAAPPAYHSGQWKIGIGQFMGLPDSNSYSTDSAVDWVRAEPSACGAADMGSAGGVPLADGALDNNDFIAFINHFFDSDAVADVGRAGGEQGADGAFDNNDFIAFITLFFQGC